MFSYPRIFVVCSTTGRIKLTIEAIKKVEQLRETHVENEAVES
jgi:hypothetical protein